MKNLYIVVLFCLVSGIALFAFMYLSGKKPISLNKEDAISYNFQVRPILSDKCYACHGPDANKREAGLRLDIREEAYKALKNNPKAHAIVPGKPHLSELYIRVSATDTAIMMPPASGNLPALTKTEVAIIKKWIEEGARYEPHWAFVPPQKSPVPKVKKKRGPKMKLIIL
ncbi:c-type cytochrome domain-containing protein [Agriterribacter sp.]|uniref:c-type cytochrome domain-containing protein n=1 Tax=Agriterribacter sp. TaxID=2821509 RepID=UPI002BE1A211|nr:c-type cytochrome domain-containing protein [Agriterribacter sp.]HRO46931.1 hypothetical protein [Agriterribacter sp.]HRQ17425.1 hypothetical protein [Agriterribacter sp.]